MARRLILWDIDGTLVSCGTVGREALEVGAAVASGRHDLPTVSMGGKTDPQIIGEILHAAGFDPEAIVAMLPKALAAAERHLAEARPRLAREGFVHPGIKELLVALADSPGVRQTLLTGNVEPNAFVKVDTFGLAGFFDFAVGAYGSDHAERDRLVPISMGRVARLRGEQYGPDEVWVIGDTENDLRCARAGNARCTLVGTGKGGPTSVEGLDADRIFEDLSDTDEVLRLLLDAE